jgi:putative ABC transport system permease protein
MSRPDETDGGRPARRAVRRWAVRMFRREWREQALVLALLTVVVAAAVTGMAAAYELVPASERATFGSARYRLEVDGTDPVALDAGVDASREWFGTIDVIGRRRLRMPGMVDEVELRMQDPTGAYAAPMLALVDGRLPARPGEVALTDAVAADLRLALGDGIEVGGTDRQVVGVVENPHDLHDEFVMALPGAAAPETASILVGGSADRFAAFVAPPPARIDGIAIRSGNSDLAAVVALLGVFEIALLLVSLVAAAGFVVVAHRRLRQLGMLAAIGATPHHLRTAMVANGTVVGATAATIGAMAGIAAWIAAAPLLEGAAGQRIDRLHLPWLPLAAALVLAVATSTAAAWWPARVVARVPVTHALSGRPPRPGPVHRSATASGLLVATGLLCLVVAGDPADEFTIHWTDSALLGAGVLLAVVGLLMASPLTLRTSATVARWLPVAPRLAVRDVTRFPARTAAGLAAIGLALGIPIAVVVLAAAAEHGPTEGNLSDRQMVVRPGDRDAPFVPVWTPGRLAQAQDQVERVAAPLDAPGVVPLEVAYDPAVAPDGDRRPVVTLATSAGGSMVDLARVYVATPALLEVYGVDPDLVPPDRELLTWETGRLSYLDTADPDTGRFTPQPVRSVHPIDRQHTSLPHALITPAGLRARGWESAPAAWLIEADRPFTDTQRSSALARAAAADLTVETRTAQDGLGRLRTAATAAAALLALGILAMTVGLIRVDSARDVRVLTATGATSYTRRAVTATTSGWLALSGALLGLLGSYLVIGARHLDHIGALRPAPLGELAALALGIPSAAFAAGWLLSGRHPADLGHRPLD